MSSPPDDPTPADEAQPNPDHVPIADDDFILRKIPSTPHIQAPNGGKRRVSKSAFSASSPAVDPEEGMSTNSEALLAIEGIDASSFAPEFPVLARLRVSDVRGLQLTVEHRPVANDYSHCQVLGIKDKHRKRLLQMAEFIRKPDDVE